MKYIYNEDGAWKLTEYFNYLDTIKGLLSDNIAGLVCDHKRYDLSSAESLHDAWLVNYSVDELHDEGNVRSRFCKITVKLLGPFHDREFILTYDNVVSYNVSESGDSNLEKGHGDLIVHELRLSEAGNYTHELLFSSGLVINIESKSIKFIEKIK
jgi:hypothetical protein